MESLSNKYAIAALKDRKASIAGEMTTIEARLRYLRKMAEHVDHALLLLNPDIDPQAIPPKRQYKRIRLFRAGELNRLILNALRKAGKPQSAIQVTDAILLELGHGPEARAGLRHRVRANLCYLLRERGLVTKEGDRVDARWSLAQLLSE